MSKHKWAKEIHAWADGAEIEQSLENASGWTDWHNVVTPTFYTSGAEFRIKQQPVEVVASGQPFRFKEKKYLYVYKGQGYQYNLSSEKYATGSAYMGAYIGKIEVQDD